eukprot:scaffold11553_cov39-Cyclotella_meneghiniana.AAC.8
MLNFLRIGRWHDVLEKRSLFVSNSDVSIVRQTGTLSAEFSMLSPQGSAPPNNIDDGDAQEAASIRTDTYEVSDEENIDNCNNNENDTEDIGDDVSGESSTGDDENDGHDIVQEKDEESSDYAPEENSSSDDSSEEGDYSQKKITHYNIQVDKF